MLPSSSNMYNDDGDNQQDQETVSPLNVEGHEFDEFMKKIVRVPPRKDSLDNDK